MNGIFCVFGLFITGYEIRGVENVPSTGGALFIYYHGAIPIDLYYFMSKLHLQKNTFINPVADYFLFKIPGSFPRFRVLFGR